jgi:hypothetical protein
MTSDLSWLLVSTVRNFGWQFIEQQSECCLLNVLCSTDLDIFSCRECLEHRIFRAFGNTLLHVGTSQHLFQAGGKPRKPVSVIAGRSVFWLLASSPGTKQHIGRRVLSSGSQPMFRRNVASIFRVEEQTTQESRVNQVESRALFLWNVGWLSTDYKALYFRDRTIHNLRCENIKSCNIHV